MGSQQRVQQVRQATKQGGERQLASEQTLGPGRGVGLQSRPIPRLPSKHASQPAPPFSQRSPGHLGVWKEKRLAKDLWKSIF